jgi:putative FmdB family regulatory protein
MPTYDYICSSCGNAWEFEQRIVEEPVKVCPKCGKKTAKRQISAGAGFILKGGGWYADLYGSSKPSGGDAKTSSGDSKSDDKTTKPDAKTDSTPKPDAPKTDGDKGTSGSPSKGNASGPGDTNAA